ncbi:MAG: HEAT repeat domain-containing protein [Planctomycetota bacterium]|jgi:HEAT repeat protein
MKTLPVKLGIFVVLLFAVVIAGIFLYRPLRYAYLKSQMMSENEETRDKAIETLAAEGPKAVPSIREWLSTGEEKLVIGACGILEETEGDAWKEVQTELWQVLDGPVSDMTSAAAGLLIANKFDWEEIYEDNPRIRARFLFYELERRGENWEEITGPDFAGDDEADDVSYDIIELGDDFEFELREINEEIDDSSIVSRLIHILRESSNYRARNKAAFILGKTGEHKAIGPLTEVLGKDTVRQVRSKAAMALGEIGDNRSVTALAAALENDKSTQVRRFAIYGLREIGTLEAGDAVIKALVNDKKPTVRAAAADGLATLRNRKALPALISTLESDNDSDVKRECAYALAWIPDKSAGNVLLKVIRTKPESEPDSWTVSVSFDETMADLPSIGDLDSGDRGWNYDTHRWAMLALGIIEEERAVPLLIDYLKPGNYAAYRETAARALGVMRSEAAVQQLCISLSNDSEMLVRLECAESLGLIRSEEAWLALKLGLESDPDSNTRAMCAWALGQIGAAADITALVKAFESDEHLTVRTWAAHALGEIGGDNAADILASAFIKILEENEVDNFGRPTKAGLCRMIALALGNTGGEKAVEALRRNVNNKEVRTECILSLLRLSAPGVNELIEKETGKGYPFPYAALAWSRGGEFLARISEKDMREYETYGYEFYYNSEAAISCYALMRWGNVSITGFLLKEFEKLHPGSDFPLMWFHEDAFSRMPEGFPKYNFYESFYRRLKRSEAMKAWYEKHKDRLAWDVGKKRYYLKPE